MGRKYLIYVDILGYKGKAKEIAEITGIDEDVCRETFLRNPLGKKIGDITTTKFQGISEIEGSDNYLILVDTVEEATEIVGEITRIKIPHKAFQWIPLEVGVGMKEIDEDFPMNPFSRKEVITFLKEDIINTYRGYFKQEYNKSIRKTFVLFTEDFYNDLEPLDKYYCTPINHNGKSFFLGDLEKIHERCRIYEFLRKIGYPGSKLYGRIDYVYVPPVEYNDIEQTLKSKRILFIVGTREYGKTYTAVELMLKYYSKGYEPKWIRGGEESERNKVRQELENIEAELKPHCIIYFEDPFGRTRYEKREGLEREIGTIIESVDRVKDVYVIITSREEVFKEFEKEKLSKKDIKKLEKKLNLKRPSYDYKRRKEILIRWAENEGCIWIKDDALKKLILRSVRDEKVLPTPLSLRGFSIATVDVDAEDRLKEIMEEKSEETAMAFSREIKNMSDDKILFLLFLFISSDLDATFIKKMYTRLVKELDIKDAWEFDRILDWFKDDKINVSRRRIEFSHPSYSEALKYLLIEDGYVTRINKEIFSPVLLSLPKKDDIASVVTQIVAKNYDNFPDEVKDIARLAIQNTKRNFHHFPEDVRNELLLSLAEKDETARSVAEVVAENFDKLPEDVRNLLFTLAEKDGASGGVARAVTKNLHKLPEDVRNLLFTLAEKDETAWRVAWIVKWNFDKLPEDVRYRLLLTLSEKDKTVRRVAEVVVENLDYLPEDVRNKLLFTLAEKDETARRVAWIVTKHFDKLPEDVRNKLLFTLSEKDETAGDVAWIVTLNFDKLPEDVRYKLLFTLAEKDGASRSVAEVVAENLDKLPEDVRYKLLFTLSEKDETAGDVAWIVKRNFDKLPEDVRYKLLFTLAEKDGASRSVAEVVTKNFDKLPEDMRNKLLFTLRTSKTVKRE